MQEGVQRLTDTPGEIRDAETEVNERSSIEVYRGSACVGRQGSSVVADCRWELFEAKLGEGGGGGGGRPGGAKGGYVGATRGATSRGQLDYAP